MLDRLKNILGINTLERKIDRYNGLKNDFLLLKSKINDMALDYTRRKDLIDRCEDEFIKSRLQEKLDNYVVDGYIFKLAILKKDRDSLLKSIENMESDEEFMKAAKEYNTIAAFDIIKGKYRDGIIDSKRYNDIIKAKNGVVRYADMLVYDRDGKFLILKRSKDSDFEADKWSLPGGYVDQGEDFDTAANRELEEETGLKVKKCTKVGEYKDSSSYIEYHQSFLSDSEPTVTLHSEEHQDYKWIYSSDIEDYDFMLDLKDNLKGIFGQVKDGVIKIKKSFSIISEAYLDNRISEDLYSRALDSILKGEKEVEQAMQHKDKLGAGAKKRKKLKSKKDKVSAVMSEYKRGTLHSGSGEKVKDRKQAIAIAMSEAGLSKGDDSDIEKARKPAQLGEIREWKGQKMKKTAEGWIPVTDPKTKKEDPSSTGKDKPLDQYAREASEQSLKNTVANSPNEEERKAANEELVRREKEEKSQEEEKTGKETKTPKKSGGKEDGDVGGDKSKGDVISKEDREKNFKEWFGNSEVVDRNGDPLIVFHGTSIEGGFNEFDKKKLGQSGMPLSKIGFFFSENVSDANMYGNFEYGSVVPVFLKIENPYEMELDDFQKFENGEYGDDEIKDLLYDIEGVYDGIKIKNTKIWMAFESIQIKSAIGNKGTFDPKLKDITKSEQEDITIKKDYTQWL